MTALVTLTQANTCIRNGEVVAQDTLRTIDPVGPEGDVVTTHATFREFVDQHFYPEHKVKLAFFGQSRGMDNGSELSAMTRAAGYYVGKKEVAFFDKRIGGYIADWVNSYPVEILWAWVEEKTEGKYKGPEA